MSINKILTSILGFSLASWISAAINFIVLPISTRLFETSELAKVNLFYSIVMLLLNLICFGLDQGYVRFRQEYANEDDKKRLLFVCIGASTLIAVILLILALPFNDRLSFWIVGNNNFSVTVTIGVCVLTQVLYRYLGLLFRLKKSILFYNISTVCASAIIKMSYLLSGFWGKDGETAIIIMTVVSIVFICIFPVWAKKDILFTTSFNQYVNGSFLKYCIPLIPVTFITQLIMYMPQYAIRIFEGFENLGVFSTAVTLSSILTLVQSGISVFWSPFVFENAKKNPKQIKYMEEILFLIMIGCGVGLILGKDIIVLLLGENYREASLYLPLLIFSPICMTLGELTGVGTLLNKKGHINLGITVVTLFLNIVLSLAFTCYWGVLGAALASGVTAIVLFLLKTYFGQREFSTINNYKQDILLFFMMLVISIINTIENNILSWVGIVDLLFIFYIGTRLFTYLKIKKERKY